MERNIKMDEKIKTKKKEFKENNVEEGRKNKMEDKRNKVGGGRKNIVDDSEEIKVKHDKGKNKYINYSSLFMKILVHNPAHNNIFQYLGVLNSRFKHFPVSNHGFINTRKVRDSVT